MSIKIALPKGRLVPGTSKLLKESGWNLEEYSTNMHYYRLKSNNYPEIGIKVFQEKDIPIQVAIGNYDLGICGLDWIKELFAKYPSSNIIKLTDLGYGEGELWTAAQSQGVIDEKSLIRIVSEYPNLAESFAEQLRLKRFRILPIWGAAEVYPPENAELVILSCKRRNDLECFGLVPISKLIDIRAYLIVNRESFRKKDMEEVLFSITDNLPTSTKSLETSYDYPMDVAALNSINVDSNDDDTVRLALPDGHQQTHVCRIFERTGIHINDYPSVVGKRRPTSNMEGIFIKVIRPQDMPLQVANDNFDLAITGRDWLTEHKYQFPSSPVEELLDLKYGKVKIVAVISQDMPIGAIGDWQDIYSKNQMICRLASEYVNIADYYARSNHLGRYRIIPTWGATEAFLPEDADILIENTETGGTIARHKLKIIDTLFESTACLIGRKKKVLKPTKKDRIKKLVEALKDAVKVD